MLVALYFYLGAAMFASISLVFMWAPDFGPLADMYESDGIGGYLMRALLALFAFPLFAVCEIAHWAWRRRREEDDRRCAGCPRRSAAEDGTERGRGNG